MQKPAPMLAKLICGVDDVRQSLLPKLLVGPAIDLRPEACDDSRAARLDPVVGPETVAVYVTFSHDATVVYF